jgi:hypothetical protein
VISLPIGLNSSGRLSSSGDKTSRQALASAIAGAVDDPGEASDLAKLAKDEPGKVPSKAPDKPTVKRLREAIKAAQDDSTITYDLDEEIRAVSVAVGADPRLAAAAAKAIEEIDATAGQGKGGVAARRWALALLEPSVLERVARAATKADALDDTSITPTHVSEVSAKLDSLQKLFDAFKRDAARDIVDLKQRTQVNETNIAKNEAAVVRVEKDVLGLRVDVDILKGAAKSTQKVP